MGVEGKRMVEQEELGGSWGSKNLKTQVEADEIQCHQDMYHTDDVSPSSLQFLRLFVLFSLLVLFPDDLIWIQVFHKKCPFSSLVASGEGSPRCATS
mmetsp:Transcript_25748/g.42278  ORF Transcript_25748/g.42278 Transcript_25748/m.42278 type:complete len:97 (-) Transcript_25748:445-735(-)